MGYRTQADADMAARLFNGEQILGDRKWVGGVEYEWNGTQLVATGQHVPGITNTPHRGEPEGSRDRHRHDACIPSSDSLAILTAAAARLPTESAKRKDVPIYSGFVQYFPDAMAEVARLSKHGNDKHNPGQPLHWSRNKSTDHLDCIQRHTLEVGTVDDDGFLHDVKIAWRAMANLQVTLERLRGLPISPGSKP